MNHESWGSVCCFLSCGLKFAASGGDAIFWCNYGSSAADSESEQHPGQRQVSSHILHIMSPVSLWLIIHCSLIHCWLLILGTLMMVRVLVRVQILWCCFLTFAFAVTLTFTVTSYSYTVTVTPFTVTVTITVTETVFVCRIGVWMSQFWLQLQKTMMLLLMLCNRSRRRLFVQARLDWAAAVAGQQRSPTGPTATMCREFGWFPTAEGGATHWHWHFVCFVSVRRADYSTDYRLYGTRRYGLTILYGTVSFKPSGRRPPSVCRSNWGQDG